MKKKKLMEFLTYCIASGCDVGFIFGVLDRELDRENEKHPGMSYKKFRKWQAKNKELLQYFDDHANNRYNPHSSMIVSWGMTHEVYDPDMPF